MLPQVKVSVIGFVWKSSGGGHACQRCHSLDGQEFFYSPEPGQKSTDEMPDPPLHPHCRCTVQPITRVEVELPDRAPGASEPYIHGGTKFAGGYWKNDGRSLGDGPVWKKWCGENWSGGRDVRHPDATGPADPSPADDMDGACKNHDDCYDREGQDYCDRRLVEELESLPEDPRLWKNPPREEELGDAKQFRKWAIRWFKLRIHSQEIREQGFWEEPSISP